MLAERQHVFEISLRVLVSREAGEVVAHALELDLLGCGPDEQSAMDDLVQAIETQVSFAATRREENLIGFPAPQEDFDLWEKIHRANLPGFPRTRKGKFRAVVMVWKEASAPRKPSRPRAALPHRR